jgi:uncharacterized protein YktA (UPF0223 family)
MAYPIKELLNLMFVNNVNNFINKKLDRFEIRNKYESLILIVQLSKQESHGYLL